MSLVSEIQALIDAARASGTPDLSGLDISLCKADHIDARGADLSYLKAGYIVPSGGSPVFTNLSHLDANEADMKDSTITGDISGSNLSGLVADQCNLTNVAITDPSATSGFKLEL